MVLAAAVLPPRIAVRYPPGELISASEIIGHDALRAVRLPTGIFYHIFSPFAIGGTAFVSVFCVFLSDIFLDMPPTKWYN